MNIIFIIIVWNIVTFFMMRLDKQKAIKGKRRISERTLFSVSFALGGIGIYLGMFIFRHKTKHKKFLIFVPLAIFFNILIFLWLMLQ